MNSQTEVKSYRQALEFLKGRKSRKLENNTYVEVIDENSIGVRLHQTYVVTYLSDGLVVLSLGGWNTMTTKDRINKYSNLGIYQRKRRWFVGQEIAFEFQALDIPFIDGMKVNPIGEIENRKPISI